MPDDRGAAFFTGRAHVAVQLVSAMVATGWLAHGRLAGRDATAIVVLGELFVLVVVAVTVRLMRELAWYALEQAQRREVTDPLSGLAYRRGLETVGGRRWRDAAKRGGRNQVVLTTAVEPGRAPVPADVAPVVAAGSRRPGRGEPRTADAAQS